VRLWDDLSGNNVGVFQTTALFQPTYVFSGGINNLPYIDCGVGSIASSLLFKSGIFTSLTSAELFIVASNGLQPQSNGLGILYSIGGILPIDNGATYVPLSVNNGIYEGFGAKIRHDNVVTINDTRFAPNVPYIWNVFARTSNDTNGYSITLNGTTLVSGTNTFSIGNTTALANSDGTNAVHYFFGRKYEVILYNRVLSSYERMIVTTYCKYRYGINWN
jgi:hypothetical protein